MSIFISIKSYLKRNKITSKFLSKFSLKKQLQVFYFFQLFPYFLWVKYSIKKTLPNENKPRLLFIEGSIARDRDGNNLIISKLPQSISGISVFHLQHRNYIKCYQPNIVIIPEGYSLYLEFVIDYCKKRDIKIITLYSEGALVPESEHLWAGGVQTDFEIVWGPKTLDVLKRYRPDSSKLAFAGNPRYDIHYEYMLNSKIKIKPVIIYATNFPHFGLETEADPSLFMHDIPTLKLIRNDNFKIFLNSVLNFPEYDFILRTHPMERDDYYREVLNKSEWPKNLTVYQPNQTSDSIYEILSSISLLCTWASTTSTEAWFYNLPTVSIQSHRYPIISNLTGSEGSDIVKSEIELENLIRYYLKDKNEVKDGHKIFRNNYIKDWYYKIDGKSSERVIKIIMDVLKTN